MCFILAFDTAKARQEWRRFSLLSVHLEGQGLLFAAAFLFFASLRAYCSASFGSTGFLAGLDQGASVGWLSAKISDAKYGRSSLEVLEECCLESILKIVCDKNIMASSASKGKTCMVICGQLPLTICLLCLQELFERILFLLVYFFHCFYYEIVKVDRSWVNQHKTKNENEEQKVLSDENHHVGKETREIGLYFQAWNLGALDYVLHVEHADAADLAEQREEIVAVRRDHDLDVRQNANGLDDEGAIESQWSGYCIIIVLSNWTLESLKCENENGEALPDGVEIPSPI